MKSLQGKLTTAGVAALVSVFIDMSGLDGGVISRLTSSLPGGLGSPMVVKAVGTAVAVVAAEYAIEAMGMDV